jgi:hypothetical protein
MLWRVTGNMTSGHLHIVVTSYRKTGAYLERITQCSCYKCRTFTIIIIIITIITGFRVFPQYFVFFFLPCCFCFMCLKFCFCVFVLFLYGTVELHLPGLIWTANHPDIQKIRIFGFFFENRLHGYFELGGGEILQTAVLRYMFIFVEMNINTKFLICV